MRPVELWALGLLDRHPRVAPGWAGTRKGAPHDRAEIYDALASLESLGLAAYDPRTLSWTITAEGRTAMRFPKKNNPQNSPAAGPSDPTSGGGTNTGAGAGSSPAPAPVSLTAERDRIVLEFHGPGAFALDVVRDEPDLYERLAQAMEDGLPAPSVIDLPRRRRIVAIEEALDAWASSTSGGPCAWCGSRTPGAGIGRGYLDNSPGFTARHDGRVACAWCSDYLNAHSEDDLRAAVFRAVVGVQFTPTITAAVRASIPFASESGLYGTVPWSHLTDAQRGALRLAAYKVVHPSRFVRTEGMAESLSIPGIAAPVHTAETVPSRPAVNTVRTTPTPAEVKAGDKRREQAQRAERLAALDAEHAAERAAYLAKFPRTFDGTEREWEGAEGWTALLARQRDAASALGRRHTSHVGPGPWSTHYPGAPAANVR